MVAFRMKQNELLRVAASELLSMDLDEFVKIVFLGDRKMYHRLRQEEAMTGNMKINVEKCRK